MLLTEQHSCFPDWHACRSGKEERDREHLSGGLCLDDEADEGNHRESPILDLLCLHLLHDTQIHTGREQLTCSCKESRKTTLPKSEQMGEASQGTGAQRFHGRHGSLAC